MIVNWEIEKIDTGNLFRWSILKANVLTSRKIERCFVETFKPNSFLNISLLMAKNRIKKKIRILELK